MEGPSRRNSIHLCKGDGNGRVYGAKAARSARAVPGLESARYFHLSDSSHEVEALASRDLVRRIVAYNARAKARTEEQDEASEHAVRRIDFGENSAESGLMAKMRRSLFRRLCRYVVSQKECESKHCAVDAANW
jgi:hypothetical protein